MLRGDARGYLAQGLKGLRSPTLGLLCCREARCLFFVACFKATPCDFRSSKAPVESEPRSAPLVWG